MNNNIKKCYDDDYEKIRKKFADINKNIKYCYVQGPTGPKGEKGDIGPTGPKGENGPTTIEIGHTETTSPDVDADVVNVGTNKNVILNFKIPRGKPGDVGPIGQQGPKGDKGDLGPQGIQGLQGEKGEQGPTGPQGERGLPGETGISQAITIDRTETVESNELAEVQDDFDRNVHHLTFYIPKGEKGDTGPIGPTGPSETVAYGMLYLLTEQELQLSAQAEVTIPLNERGPFFNADDTTNAINIKVTAFYLVSYYLNASPKDNCILNVMLKNNDIIIPGSNIRRDLISDEGANISNSIIAALNEGDNVTLNVRTDQGTTLSFDEYTTAVLTITKIH